MATAKDGEANRGDFKYFKATLVSLNDSVSLNESQIYS